MINDKECYKRFENICKNMENKGYTDWKKWVKIRFPGSLKIFLRSGSPGVFYFIGKTAYGALLNWKRPAGQRAQQANDCWIRRCKKPSSPKSSSSSSFLYPKVKFRTFLPSIDDIYKKEFPIIHVLLAFVQVGFVEKGWTMQIEYWWLRRYNFLITNDGRG